MLLPLPALGWGTHASPEDLIELNGDWVQFNAALNILRLPPGAMTEEKISALLGETYYPEAGVPLGTYLEAYIKKQLPEVAKVFMNEGVRVIRNPSSSCQVAVEVLRRWYSADIQLKHLEYGGPADDSPADADAEVRTPLNDIFPQIFSEVQDRCTQEAYDMCVDSGSVQPLVDVALSNAQSFQFMGSADAEERIAKEAGQRILDCGHYELNVDTQADNTVTYPVQAVYRAHVHSVLHGPLEVFYDSDGSLPTTALGLAFGHILYTLEWDMPSVQCHGAHGEVCDPSHWKDMPTVASTFPLDSIVVQYHTQRAEVVPGALTASSPTDTHIDLRDYTPPAMDKDLVVITIHEAPPLRVLVNRANGDYINEDNMVPLLLADPLRGWSHHHVEGENVEFTLNITTNPTNTEDSTGNPKTAAEQSTLTLRHRPKPMTNFNFDVMPPPLIRHPAKPAKPAS